MCKKPKQYARRGLGKQLNRLVSRVYMYEVFLAQRLTLFDLQKEKILLKMIGQNRCFQIVKIRQSSLRAISK
jgi:hypothetical protein